MQLRRLKLSGPSGIPSKTEYIHYLPISPHISPCLPSGIPSKTEYILYASLSEWQQQQYKEILNKNLSTSDGKAATLNNLLISPHISPYLPISPQAVTLNNLLMQLRKCCNHPYLFEWPISDAGEEAAGEGPALTPSLSRSGRPVGEEAVDEVLVQASGKMLLLDRLMAKLTKNGHKALLPSLRVEGRLGESGGRTKSERWGARCSSSRR